MDLMRLIPITLVKCVDELNELTSSHADEAVARTATTSSAVDNTIISME
jgi:hypothetical protein